MPWIIAAAVLGILICLFPKRAWVLVTVLASAAAVIWGGVAAYNMWKDSLIARIVISVRLPEYPRGGPLPEDWEKSGRAGELRAIWNGTAEEDQKKRAVNRIVYGCAMEKPLIADVHNGGDTALLRCSVAVEAFQPGRSTNVAGRFQTVFDTIIGPGESRSVCLPSPRLSGGLRQDEVEFRASARDALFE